MAGDVNGDGFGDVIIGANNSDSTNGMAYLYFGSATGPDSTPDWECAYSAVVNVGNSVSPAGDVNADGYDDIVIGYTGYNSQQGRIYVYHGSASGLAATADYEFSTGFTGSQLGFSVSMAGDMNGDGYGDIVVGAPISETSSEGRVYGFFGSSTGLDATQDWFAQSNVTAACLGYSVAHAGDVNADGFADVVVGATIS